MLVDPYPSLIDSSLPSEFANESAKENQPPSNITRIVNLAPWFGLWYADGGFSKPLQFLENCDVAIDTNGDIFITIEGKCGQVIAQSGNKNDYNISNLIKRLYLS